jgi:hypothetical protein
MRSSNMTAAGRTASRGFSRAAGRAAKEQVVPVETTDSILRGQGRALARRSFERHRSAGQGIARDVRRFDPARLHGPEFTRMTDRFLPPSSPIGSPVALLVGARHSPAGLAMQSRATPVSRRGSKCSLVFLRKRKCRAERRDSCRDADRGSFERCLP